MKKVQIKTSIPVRVILNTTNTNRHQWAKIVDNSTGKVLHTGQPTYIRKVAAKRYNVEPQF